MIPQPEEREWFVQHDRASTVGAEDLLAKEGSIVDASFVAAPRQRNSHEQNARKKGERPEGFEADMPSSAAERPESPERGLKRPNGIVIGAKVRIKLKIPNYFNVIYSEKRFLSRLRRSNRRSKGVFQKSP